MGECQKTTLFGARDKCCQKDEGSSLKSDTGTKEPSWKADPNAPNPDPSTTAATKNDAPPSDTSPGMGSSSATKNDAPPSDTSPGMGTSSTAATPTSTADTRNSLVPCTNDCNLCDIIMGLKRIFSYLGTLLVIVATLFIIVAGIAYMVSGGSKNLMEWAKKALMYALIGFVLYLASWLIVSSILTAMGYNRSGWSTFNCETGSESSK